jgi:hypothetical protein
MLFAVLFCAHSTTAAYADLRYTTHVDVRLTPVATASDPVLTQVATLLQGMMPSGETRTYLTTDAARLEPVSGTAGPVILFRPDGQTVLDPATRTFWRIPIRDLAGALSPPQMTSRATGEFTTILGLKAERIEITTSVSLPVAPPAGFPTALTLQGELWVTDAHASYAKSLGHIVGPLELPGHRPFGIVLRQVLRNAQFGYEVEYSITELVEAPIAASMFQVPSDYQEVTVPRALQR